MTGLRRYMEVSYFQMDLQERRNLLLWDMKNMNILTMGWNGVSYSPAKTVVKTKALTETGPFTWSEVWSQPKHGFYCQSVLLPLEINHTDVVVRAATEAWQVQTTAVHLCHQGTTWGGSSIYLDLAGTQMIFLLEDVGGDGEMSHTASWPKKIPQLLLRVLGNIIQPLDVSSIVWT